LKMPRSQIPKNRDWYPPAAKRRGEQGVVDIEYSIGSCPRNSPARTLGAEVVTICGSLLPR
jgi:hypothetical protein